MKRILAALAALTLVAAACGDDSGSADAEASGAVVIDSPGNALQVEAGTSVSVQVTATDDQGVARIDLQINGSVVASATNASATSPFTAIQAVAPSTPGSSSIVAVAYRSDGSVIGSAQIGLTVTGDAVAETTTTTTEGAEGSTTTSGATGTTSGSTGTTSGGTATTTHATTTTQGTTTTTTTATQQAPDDGGDGSQGSPPEHSVTVVAENNNPDSTVFFGAISVPGDRGDGIRIDVDNLSSGVNSDTADVSVLFICTPGGPTVRSAPAGYVGGSSCDNTYNTTFFATYQSVLKTYYIYVPDGVEGYFEYQLNITAVRD